MHETARYAIDSFESLSVSAEIMEAMRQEVIDLCTTHRRGGSDHDVYPVSYPAFSFGSCRIPMIPSMSMSIIA
jgi:hypothetical protein